MTLEEKLQEMASAFGRARASVPVRFWLPHELLGAALHGATLTWGRGYTARQLLPTVVWCLRRATCGKSTPTIELGFDIMREFDLDVPVH